MPVTFLEFLRMLSVIFLSFIFPFQKWDGLRCCTYIQQLSLMLSGLASLILKHQIQEDS